MSELPTEIVDEAERLTRLARRAVDKNEAAAYRGKRKDLLVEYGFVPRVREEGDRAVLVCYPAEWVADGTVQMEQIGNTDRAVERLLKGSGEDPWAEVDAHNREIVSAVEEQAGPIHGANVAAFADFMGNHYRRRIETATDRHVEEFLTEYYPRNAWPSDDQRAVVEESLVLAFDIAGDSPVDLDEIL